MSWKLPIDAVPLLQVFHRKVPEYPSLESLRNRKAVLDII